MTPARRKEAEQAGEAYHLALAALGVAAFDEVLGLWESLPASDSEAAFDKWFRDVFNATTAHRLEARDLTFAYYRLNRALRVGTTITGPDGINDGVTLGTLRSDFASAVESVIDNPDITPSAPETDPEVVIEEDVDGLDADLREADEEAEEDQRDYVKSNLTHLHIMRDRARNVKEQRKAAANAAAITAASAQKGAMDGGRSTLHSVTNRDRKAIGYVRISRTGDPCAFCRMLISRGLNLSYKSAKSATFAEGEKYHPNCQCVGEPVFSESQYENDPRFSLNRELEALWPEVTEGYSGRDALNAWRRYWRKRSETVNPDLYKKTPRAPAA